MNNKLTKQELMDSIVKGITELGAGVEKALKDSFAYTKKQYDADEKAVPKDVLQLLKKDVDRAVAVLKGIDPKTPIEASVKPKLKPKATAKDTKEAKVVTPAEKTEEKPAENKKETVPTKEEPPKVETSNGLTKNDLPMAKIFPVELNHEILGTLKAAPEKYSTMDEIEVAINAGAELYFACYWTKRHIKEFGYAVSRDVEVPKKGFDNDLDMLQPIFICKDTPKLHAISTLTEALFTFKEEDLERIECESPTGDKFSMRYSIGLEFEIYELVV